MPTGLKIALVIIIGVMLAFSAFFSGAETAYTSVSQAKIREQVNKGTKSALLVTKHIKSFGWTLSTILIGNNLVNIASSTTITYLFSSFLSEGIATLVATAIMTPIIVLLCEIAPKLFAKKHAWGYLKKVAYTMEVLNFIFLPFTFFLSKIAISTTLNTESELKSMLSIASEEGVLEKREATLAKNALDLDSTVVWKIMTKLKKIKFIDIGDSVKHAKKIIIESGHSRIPVKENHEFIGVVHAKDILSIRSIKVDESIIKHVPNISRNTLAPIALEIMRYNKSHFAFVVKSNNSTQVVGLITLENIFEQLVGKIYDEFDERKDIMEIGLHKHIVNGNILLSSLADHLQYRFNGNTKNLTVEKWLKKRLNRSIKKNLVYTYNKEIRFKVVSNKKGHPAKFEVTQK